MNYEKIIIKAAKEKLKTIVLPEADFSERIVKAGIAAAKKNIAKIIFLTNGETNLPKAINVSILNMQNYENVAKLTETLYYLRKEKGLTLQQAETLMQNPIYFGTMLVKTGLADGMVAGAETATKDVLLPAFQLIKGKNGRKVSSVFMLPLKKNKILKQDRLVFISDASIIIDPTATELSDIAENTIEFAKPLQQNLKLAFLSHATLKSGTGENVDKINEAMAILNTRNVNFVFDGPFQGDAALRLDVCKTKANLSVIKGDANVFVCPEIASANIAVKLLQIGNGCKSIGPISVGFDKPVNDVSRGATVSEIVDTIAITCMQALN